MDLKNKILQLQKDSSALEPSPEERKETLAAVSAYTDDFLNRLPNIPAFENNHDESKPISDFIPKEETYSIEELLEVLKATVDSTGLNAASGGHLGYIPGGGIYYSALADYMADVSNRYAGIYYSNPGAVRIENMMIQWMCSLAGFPKNSAGYLSSGGSMANLSAIVTARDTKKIKAAEIEKSVIYLSHQAHHSIDKAIRIAGLNEAILRFIPLDEYYRIKPNLLKTQIEEDIKSGLKPFLVIGAAGTTDVGAIDPLEEIGNIAQQFNLWFHVDAAYGGFFLLTEEGKAKMKGIETADSVTMDPHKGLFLPYGSGALIVKDAQALAHAHHYQANYMQDAKYAMDELSPAELSPELTKHFRGLRMWLPLMLIGTKPFAAALEEKLLLAQYFYKEIQKIKDFEVGNAPDLSVVTYRFAPQGTSESELNELNEALLKEIQNDGRVFISSTLLNNKFTLRLAVLSFRTHLHTIDLLIDLLKAKSKKLSEL